MVRVANEINSMWFEKFVLNGRFHKSQYNFSSRIIFSFFILCDEIMKRVRKKKFMKSMVVKITIWIIGLHNFMISPHQTKTFRIIKIVGSYGILPILPKHQFLVFFLNFFYEDKFLVLMKL